MKSKKSAFDKWAKQSTEKAFNPTNKLNKQLDQEYKRLFNELIVELEKASNIIEGNPSLNNIIYQNKIKSILNQITNRLIYLNSNFSLEAWKILEEVVLYSDKVHIELLEKIDPSFVGANMKAIDVASIMPYDKVAFQQSFKGGILHTRDKLNQILTTKMAKGTSLAKLIPELELTFNVSAGIAKRILRTETSRIYNAVAKKRYEEAEVSKVEWLDSTESKGRSIRQGSSKVCDRCRSVSTTNGGIYDINNVPPLPLHPNCRCTIVPYILRDGFNINEN